MILIYQTSVMMTLIQILKTSGKMEWFNLEVEFSVNAKHVYRWRKMDVPTINEEFKGKFSDAPKNVTPYEYFKYFLLKLLVN